MPLSEAHARIKNATIGSSDIAALMGESPYSQPMDVYLRLIGEKPVSADEEVDEDDPRFLGAEMESVVRERYARRLWDYLELGDDDRLDVIPHQEPVIWPQNPRVSSTPDSSVFLEQQLARVAEFKVLFFADRREWGDEHTDEVPAYYLLQCYHHILVTGAPVCDLFVWFGRQDFRHYIVRRDLDFLRFIEEQCERFLADHVDARHPPGLQYAHNGTEALIHELYPGTNGQTIELSEELGKVHEAYLVLNEKRLALEKACQTLKNELADAAGEASIIHIPGREKGAWTRKMQKRKEYTVEASESLVMRWSPQKQRTIEDE